MKLVYEDETRRLYSLGKKPNLNDGYQVYHKRTDPFGTDYWVEGAAFNGGQSESNLIIHRLITNKKGLLCNE